MSRLKIVVWHGEYKSLFDIINKETGESLTDSNPFTDRAEAERWKQRFESYNNRMER